MNVMMLQENNNAQLTRQLRTKTHPWDGDVEDRRSRMVWVSLLITAFVLLLFQSSNAQKVIFFPEPEFTEVEVVAPVNQLTDSERRAAEDYQEIMEKLSFLIRHHIEYFSNYEEFEGRKYQNLLLKILISLEKGNYCGDVPRLTSDLTTLKTSLKKEEKYLENDRSLRKLYKNVRTLRSDLDMIQEMLDEEIVDQLADHESSLSDIKIFLKQSHDFAKQKEEYQIAMYEIQELLQTEVSNFLVMKESLQINFDESKLEELLEAKELQEEFGEIIEMLVTLNLKEHDITFLLHDLDDLRDPPVPPVPPVRVPYPERHSSDYAIFSNQYKDSILVKSSKAPIIIQNKIGNVEIEGWNKNKILAEYRYEVTSDTEEDSEDFLESITLEITSDKSGIHISTGFPDLHNTKRQVLHSSMVLYVPQRNRIDITNSFGRTEIRDIRNDINLRTKNSDIFVTDIDGNVTSESRQGSSYFSDIQGSVQIASNRGKVTLEDLSSTINVSNSHAPIYLNDCEGDVTLTNSAEIIVTDHTGDVYIQNENGQTTVESLDGDLTLSGSYKPFKISNVNGSVNIVNKNGAVMLSDITGKSVVINESGVIKAHSMQGSIDFTNNGGGIYFIANDALAGNSIIRSDYGMVNIVLLDESNILMKASTEGGSIISNFDAKTKKDDFISSTTIGIGNKSKKLEVTGINATIIIKASE